MPLEYERIRDALIGRGKPVKKAKHIAAATYNKRHPDSPMTGNYERKRRMAEGALKKRPSY